MRFLTALTKISKTGYLVAFITFFIRAGQFMSLPFLAIYLTREALFSPSQIGIVLGIAGFMLSVTSVINGLFIDRAPKKKLMIGGLFLASLFYFALSYSMHLFYVLLLLNAGLGWCRSLVEISAISLLVENTPQENLSYAYSARFIGANLGVVLGPLIGALMATDHSLAIFFIAGGINVGLACGLLFYPEKYKSIEPLLSQNKISENFRALLKNNTLIMLTLINFFIWIVYAQMDTTLPQYLGHTTRNPAVLFSTLMAINALICVFFQPIILRMAELTSLKGAGMIGGLMFAVAFLLLSIHFNYPIMIISVVLMSFAELFTCPINSLLVVRIAPKHLIASYNGFTNLGLLGISVGPILGGYGLQFMGAPALFFLDALLALIIVWQYFKFISE